MAFENLIQTTQQTWGVKQLTLTERIKLTLNDFQLHRRKTEINNSVEQ